MNFAEAMDHCFDNPPGPGVGIVARPGREGTIYLGGTDFKGNPRYLTVTYDKDGFERFPYSPNREDIHSTDWFKVDKNSLSFYIKGR